MATISSTLRLMEQTTAPIQKTINAMNRMVDTMEMLNRSADMPNMDSAFGELRAEISLADHALDQFNAELQDTGQQAASVARVSNGFGGLSRVIIVANQGLQLMVGTFRGFERISSYADSMMLAAARLNLINDGLQTQAQLQNMIYESAQRSRGAYAETAGAVAKLGILAGDAFGSTGEIVAFSELLNKSFKVGGADMSEQVAGLHQLTQAMASGRLQGDEFRSIGENAPLIARAIATYMQVPMGALKELSSEGVITADIIKNAMFSASEEISKQFASIPATFGGRMTETANYALQAFDPVIDRFSGWLNSADGAVFFYNLRQGIDLAVVGVGNLMTAASATSDFFVNNWSTIEPILWGVGTAVAGLTAAYLIYRGVSLGVQAVELASAIVMAIKTGATLRDTSVTAAATAAQWGLNASLLACPVTWIVGGIILAVAALVAIGIAIRNATAECEWFNNIAAVAAGSVGALFAGLSAALYNDIAFVWNAFATFAEFLNNLFIDPVYATKKLFYDLADTTLGYVADMIYAIEGLINMIPGVEINLSSGLDNLITQIEDAKAALSSDKNVAHIARMEYENIGAAASAEYQSGSDWVHGMYTGKTSADTALAQISESPAIKGDYPPFELSGGKIDKVGGEIDISNQSLEYLNDIAEIRALGAFDVYNAVAYEQADELLLDRRDADLMRSSANSDINVYYLNYSGGVKVKNDIQQGMNLDEIKQTLYDESEAEIETGISFIEEVSVG